MAGLFHKGRPMHKIIRKGDRALLTGKATSVLVAILPSLEGMRKWTKDGLSFEPTGHNIRILTATLGIEAPPDQMAPVIPETWVSAPRKTEAFKHQDTARNHFKGKPVMALFMEQGTGKTKTVIDWMDDLYINGMITGVLVVSKNGVHRQWAVSELPKHSSSKFDARYWGEKGDPLPRFGLEIFCINWDAIKFKWGKQQCLEFIKRHKGRLLIIGDESQEMKNQNSARYKAMDEFKPYSSHRAILTGTPIAQDLTDEWVQLKWLDEDIIGIEYVTTFRSEFCIMGGFGGKSVVGHKDLDRFRRLTAPYVFRVRKVDIGMLPKQYDQWVFGLTPDQKDMIIQLREDSKLTIGGVDVVEEALAAKVLNKVQQISNGFVIGDDGNVNRLMSVGENPRINAMLQWIDSSSDKAIIWVKFIEDLNIIQEALEGDFVEYSGRTGTDDRNSAVDSFLNPKGARFFLATSAASTGLNLQGTTNRALYYSEDYNAVNRWQKEDRIDRIGTVGFTTHTDLIARGSADRGIMRNRTRKKGISDMAIEGLSVDDQVILRSSTSDIADIFMSFINGDE